MSLEFERFVLGGAVATVFEPVGRFNREGGSFEFIATNETFRAERVDSRLTVYIGRESNRVVGCLIEGVRAAPQGVNRVAGLVP